MALKYENGKKKNGAEEIGFYVFSVYIDFH